MYHVSVCHRLLSCVVRSRPVIVYLVPMQRIFIECKMHVTSGATPLCLVLPM